MAEEIKDTPAPAASPTATTAEAAAPSIEAPASAPADSVKPETAVEPLKTETAETKAETLLGGDKTPETQEPVEPVEPAKEEPKVDAPKEEAVAEPVLPTFEAFKIPDGIQFDDAKLGDFSKTLSEFELTSKASHEEVQKLGQGLIDRHIAEVNETLERYTKSLTESWEKQKTDWKDAFLKDPDFTNRTDTVVNAAIDAISIYGGNDTQQKEFRDLMESSGLGNHPAVIRLLSNIMLAKTEPRPLAAPQIATSAKSSKIEKMYGKKTG